MIEERKMTHDREEQDSTAGQGELPRDLTHFVDRPLTLLEEAFKALTADEIKALLPEELQGIPLDELKRMCHSQLCRLPKSSLLEILNVTSGSEAKRPKDSPPRPRETDSPVRERARLEQEYRNISLMCTTAQMEILELELRARAIRSLMEAQGQKASEIKFYEPKDDDDGVE